MTKTEQDLLVHRLKELRGTVTYLAAQLDDIESQLAASIANAEGENEQSGECAREGCDDVVVGIGANGEQVCAEHLEVEAGYDTCEVDESCAAPVFGQSEKGVKACATHLALEAPLEKKLP